MGNNTIIGIASQDSDKFEWQEEFFNSMNPKEPIYGVLVQNQIKVEKEKTYQALRSICESGKTFKYYILSSNIVTYCATVVDIANHSEFYAVKDKWGVINNGSKPFWMVDSIQENEWALLISSFEKVNVRLSMDAFTWFEGCAGPHMANIVPFTSINTHIDTNSFTIREIADWQIKCNESQKVVLPNIQRGFVWKANQMENLWDSLMRGFPIGSFLITNSGDKMLLLDGQQRATTIAAGFYNPFEDSSTNINFWSIKGCPPIIWIDIAPKIKPEENAYLFRVLTRSHPWGYSNPDNSNRITTNMINTALTRFDCTAHIILGEKYNGKTIMYTDLPRKAIFPYLSYFPIPLCFFMSDKSFKASDIIDQCRQYVPNEIKTGYDSFKDKQEYLEKLEAEDNQLKIERILDLSIALRKKTIHFDRLSDNAIIQTADNQDIDKDEEAIKDPTLFIRINRSGTPLSSDDLIYSIFKSKYSELKSINDDPSSAPIALFLSPVFLTSIAIRIAGVINANGGSYPSKMSINDFQTHLSKSEYYNNLSLLLKEFGPLVSSAIGILEHPCEDIQLPKLLLKRTIENAPDLFMLLIYWIYVNRINTDTLSNESKKQIAGRFTYFSWFVMPGSTKKSKVARTLWQYVTEADLWQRPLSTYNKDAQLFSGENNTIDDLMSYPISPCALEKYIKEKDGNGTNNNADTARKGNLLNTILNNKSLLLFAQRTYINNNFGEYNQYEGLEDTNVPWDWDHIYPISWVFARHQVPSKIRQYYNYIGNLRALSFRDNRRENNKLSPKDRLADKQVQTDSFITNYEGYWDKIDHQLKDNEDDKDKCNTLIQAINDRIISLYSDWWNKFSIQSLIGEGNDIKYVE